MDVESPVATYRDVDEFAAKRKSAFCARAVDGFECETYMT